MKENSGQDRKQKIRDKYKGTDASEIEIIPAKPTADFMESGGIRRVAAYVRVSTDNDEQTSSYELQKNYYTEYITGHPGWELVGIYADEGISGTSIAHRKGMLQMIEDCKAGKIDLIMTKSIARFARNIVDCLSVIDLLKNLEPPVGVQFEADNIYTLDNNGRMILTILASVAEEESHSKSVIMNWSIERRFRKGLFLTPELLGYDRDEDGDLIVNEDEAETVKAIYYLYLNGVSFSDIADFLYNSTKQMFAIQACGMDAEGANRVPKKNQDDRYEIKSKNLVRLLYQSCGWDRTRSYRLPGVEYPQQRLVNYDLCRAIPIFEGKVDKENESAQEPVQATSGAENI